MVEVGNVVDIKEKDNVAVVRFDRKSSCSSCGMCAFKKNEMKIDVKVENKLNAKCGEKVQIQLSDAIVISAAIIAYIIPLLFAVVGLLIGQLVGNEIFQLFLCLGMLVVGYTIIIICDRRLKLTRKITPQMVGIVSESSEEIQVEKENIGNDK